MDGTEDGANGFDEEDLRGQDGAADEDGAEDRQLVHSMNHENKNQRERPHAPPLVRLVLSTAVLMRRLR